MSNIYTRMNATARRLLRPADQGGFGQGTIVLTRITNTPPVNPWEPSVPTSVSEVINGAVKGVDSRLVGTEAGGTVLLSSDRVAICEVPSMSYQAGDVLSVDGKPVHIIDVQNIPAAGITSAVKFFIR